jgi:archaellum biogenesis protein FlaJ (TadC family)
MISAVVVGFVVQLLGLFLIHGIWLKQDYLNTAATWRTQEAAVARVWAMLLGTFIYVVGAVLIYVRGREAKPWMGQGIRFGILLALVVVVYSSLTGWVIIPVPHQLVVKWIISETLLAVVLGLVIAAICRPPASPSAYAPSFIPTLGLRSSAA